MNYSEFDMNTTYQENDVVWFGELAFIALDIVALEAPDSSKRWKIYTRPLGV